MKVGRKGQDWQYGHHAEEILDCVASSTCMALNGAYITDHSNKNTAAYNQVLYLADTAEDYVISLDVRDDAHSR
jgi:hypothetical protein